MTAGKNNVIGVPISQQTLKKLADRIIKSEFPPFDAKKIPPPKQRNEAQEPADTLGWDTTFSCKYPDVNKTIALKKSSPTSYEQEVDEDPLFYTGKADFADWQLAQGGSGRIIHMLIPFSDAEVQVRGGNVVPVGSGRLYIEVQLNMIPAEVQSARAQKNPDLQTMNLLTRTTDDDGGSLPVGIVQCLYDQEVPDVVDTLFQASFSDWINRNLDQFHHIFAAIDINRAISEHDDWAFCTPSYTSYACLSRSTLEESIFSVLNMTGGRSGEENVQQADEYVITGDYKAAFLVSQERFLVDIVKPLINKSYPGLAPENLVLNQNKKRLDMQGEMDLDPITHDGKNYTPKCTFMEIRAEPTELVVDTTTMTELGSGYRGRTKSKSFFRVVLGTNGEGKQTLNFVETRDPETEDDVLDPSGKKADAEARSIFGEIVKAILGILLEYAIKLIATLVKSILFGKPTDESDDIGTPDAPSVEFFVLNGVDPIEWPEASGLTLQDSSLNLSLCMRGFLTDL